MMVVYKIMRFVEAPCGGSSTLIRPLLLSSRSTLGGTRTTTKAPITTHWKDKVLPIGPPVRYCSARPPDKPAVVRVTSPGVSHTSFFFSRFIAIFSLETK